MRLLASLLAVSLLSPALLVACSGDEASNEGLDPGTRAGAAGSKAAGAGGVASRGGAAGASQAGAGGQPTSAGAGGSGAGAGGDPGAGGDTGAGGDAGSTASGGQAGAAGEGSAGESGAGGQAGGMSGSSGQGGQAGAGGKAGAGGGGKAGSGGQPAYDFPTAFASPSIVRDGKELHMYLARQVIKGQVVNSPHAVWQKDHWQYVGDALPDLGAGATKGGFVWAPGVALIAPGKFVHYYTAEAQDSDPDARHMCIWRAVSSGGNTFVDNHEGPLVCPQGAWAIDAYPVRDAQDNWHLLARIDDGQGTNNLQIRQLGPGGENFAPGSQWQQLLSHKDSPGSWENPIIENGAIVRLKSPNGGGRWLVFYSGNDWRSNKYAIGYGDCGNDIHGPCTKKTAAKPWMATDPSIGMYGPGTPTFYPDTDGDVLMAVSAWPVSISGDSYKQQKQSLFVFKIKLNSNDVPVVTFVAKYH